MVDHPRQIADLRQLEVVLDETALRRTRVVGRDDEQRVGAGPGGVLGQRLRLEQRLRAGCRHDWHALLRATCTASVHEPIPLVDAQRRRLGGRAVHQNAVRAVLDMELDDAGVGVVVDFAVFEMA